MFTTIPNLIPRILDDSDFLNFKEIAMDHDCWQLDYNKNGTKIWSKALPDAAIKMIKIWASFTGFSASVLFSTVMDNIYRKVWDSNFILGYEIGFLNSNNAVSYYAISCPPLKNRDLVLQTSWLEKDSEHYMLNHSICHKDHPPKPGFVRAISYFTGYYIKSLPDNGCEMTFVSQADPQGIIPTWVVNKMTLVLAPRYVKKLEQAAKGYIAWKTTNTTYFPWWSSDPSKLLIISIKECVPSDEEKKSHFFRYILEKELKVNTSEGPLTPGPSVADPNGNQDSIKSRKCGKRKFVRFLRQRFISRSHRSNPEA